MVSRWTLYSGDKLEPAILHRLKDELECLGCDCVIKSQRFKIGKGVPTSMCIEYGQLKFHIAYDSRVKGSVLLLGDEADSSLELQVVFSHVGLVPTLAPV